MRTLNCNSVSTQVSVYDLLSRPLEVSSAPLVSASERSDTLVTGTVVPSTHIYVLNELNPCKNSGCSAEYEKSKHINNCKIISVNNTSANKGTIEAREVSNGDVSGDQTSTTDLLLSQWSHMVSVYQKGTYTQHSEKDRIISQL